MEITMAPGSWLLYYSTIADIRQESIFDFNTTPPPPKKKMVITNECREGNGLGNFHEKQTDS